MMHQRDGMHAQVSAMVEMKQIRDASSMGSAYLAAAVTAAAAADAH
jgi:hypothetical protein